MLNSITSADIHAYFRNFDIFNAQKRKGDNGQECEKMYRNSLSPLTISKIMQDAIQNANDHLQNKNYKKLYEIPWKFLSFSSRGNGEAPMPHTHGDIIFLPRGWENRKSNAPIFIREMTKTLIHEKIHIYQRMFPIETHYLLYNIWNIKPVQSQTPFLYQKKLFDKKKNSDKEKEEVSTIRLNPDTNSFIYAANDRKDMIIPRFVNKSDDTFYIKDKRDHPFEMMAYNITEFILGEKKPSPKEKEWMETML